MDNKYKEKKEGKLNMEELEKKYTPLLVIEEASRCLLCHDAPCSKECPANTDPARVIRAVRFRNFKGAAEIVRENNALGAICARVCPTEKLCQSACSRCGLDKPIEIGKIQEYITDFEASLNMEILHVTGNNQGRIAIVGSGPAGLEAAATLRISGYDVDVYEKRKEIGGWLAYGIPEYRLPKEVLETEIERITKLGVKFITNHNVDSNSFARIRHDYDAVLLATGLSEGRNLDMFENNPNVVLAVDFLAKCRQDNLEVDKEGTHLIIGGGDVAMDVATSLKLKGAKNVICVARETAEEFLASKHELENAHKLDVSILDGYTPTKVDGDKVEFSHMKVNSTLTIKASHIYMAVGQKTNLEGLDVKSERGIIITNNYQTSIPGVFACGDATLGDKLVVYAVKQGKEAAHAIEQYLKGGKKNG